MSSTRRSGTATPNSSITRMSTTSMPRARSACRSARSTERIPNRCRSPGAIRHGASSSPNTASSPASPHSSAADMPCMLPDGVVSGVLKSACASSHSTTSGRPASLA